MILKLKLFSLCLLIGTSAYAESPALDIQTYLNAIKENKLTLEQVRLLTELDSRDRSENLELGYALCVSHGVHEPYCARKGTLGYGLCVTYGTHEEYCAENGSLGYGLCVAFGIYEPYCNEEGSVGYGLCVLNGTNEEYCEN